MPQLADFGGFVYDLTRPPKREMPTVVQTLRKLPKLANGLVRGLVIAKSAGSGEPVLH
jgi:hypothetical protein